MWDSRCSSSLPANSTPTVVILGAAVAVQQLLGILLLSSFLSCYCLTPSLSQHRLLSLLCNGLIFLLPQLPSNCSFYLNCIFVILRYCRKCHPSVSPKNGIVSPLFTAFLSPSKRASMWVTMPCVTSQGDSLPNGVKSAPSEESIYEGNIT